MAFSTFLFLSYITIWLALLRIPCCHRLSRSWWIHLPYCIAFIEILERFFWLVFFNGNQTKLFEDVGDLQANWSNKFSTYLKAWIKILLCSSVSIKFFEQDSYIEMTISYSKASSSIIWFLYDICCLKKWCKTF